MGTWKIESGDVFVDVWCRICMCVDIQQEGMSIGLTCPLFLSVVACGHLITLLVSQLELLLLLELPQLLVQAVLLERLCHLR